MINFNDTDIILACEARSGSHLVASFLNSHSQICNHGETINRNAIQGNLQLAIRHYQYWSDRFLEKKVVHVVRHNLWNLSVSKILTLGNQKVRYHYSKDKQIEVEIDTDQVVEFINRYKKIQDKMFKKVQGPNVFNISYEELTEDETTHEMPENIARPLLSFLGLEYEKLSTHHIKPKYLITYI